MKRCLTVWFAFGLLAFAGRAAEMVNGVAVIVNDTIITYEDVQRDMGPRMDLIEKRFGRNPKLAEEQINVLQSNVTVRLVERALILHDFKKTGYNLPDTLIDEIVNDEIREKFGDRVTLTKTLQAEGKTFESFKQDVRNRFIESQMEMLHISSDKIIISPHKIENYYVLNREKYKVGDQVKLRMIVLNQAPGNAANQAKNLARQILSKIQEGSSFAEMASVYSESPQKSQGGDYGWVERTTLVKALSDTAFELEPKKTSGVLGLVRESSGKIIAYHFNDAGQVARTVEYDKDGAKISENTTVTEEPATAPREFYILQVEDKKVSYSKPLPEVRDEIEQVLKLEERERQRQMWISRLKKQSFVRYF